MQTLFLPIFLAFADPTATARELTLTATVLELQPHADPRFATTLARALDRWADTYGVDPFLSLALAMQESSLNPDAVSATNDIGLFQLSPGTAHAYKIDRTRFKKDIDYQVRQHFRILRDKMQMCPGKNGWSCYHSVTAKHRRDYEQHVKRYLKKAA